MPARKKTMTTTQPAVATTETAPAQVSAAAPVAAAAPATTAARPAPRKRAPKQAAVEGSAAPAPTDAPATTAAPAKAPTRKRAPRAKRTVRAPAAQNATAAAPRTTSEQSSALIEGINSIMLAADTQSVTIEQWPSYNAIREEMFKRDHDAYEASVAATPDGKHPKQPMMSHYGIEVARVRRMLDKHGLNSAVTKFIRPIMERSTVAQEPSEDGKQRPPKVVLSEEDTRTCSLARAARVRVGAHVAMYLTPFCEEIVNDLAHIGLEGTKRAERHIMYAYDIFARNGALIENSRFKGLFRHLPSFEAMRTKCRDNEACQTAARVAEYCLARFGRSLAAGRAHDDYRAMHDHVSALRTRTLEDIAVSAEPVHDDAAADETKEQDSKNTRFAFYVRNMTRTIIRSNEDYKTMRVGSDFVPFVDAVLTDFVHLVASYVLIQTRMRNVQTVSRSMVGEVIRQLMIIPSDVCAREITAVSSETVTIKVPKKDAAGVVCKDATGATVFVDKEIEKPIVTVRESPIDDLIDSIVSIYEPTAPAEETA